VISPVPVILKRFLALEFVLTFGILHAVLDATLKAVSHRRNAYGAVWAIAGFGEAILQAFLWVAKVVFRHQTAKLASIKKQRQGDRCFYYPF
jgi:hypothetical protein